MPPRKRKAPPQSNEELATNIEGNGEEHVAALEEAPKPPPQPTSAVEERKRKDRDLARRRAAHFATWDGGINNNNGTDGSVDADGVHAGGSNARELGPWSSAVQLANARKQEKEKRENKILEAAREEKTTHDGQAAETPIWTPSRDPSLGVRPCCNVPLLSEITTRLVTDLIEDVQTLFGLPDLVKNQLATEVSKRRALNPATLRLFTEHSPAEICLPDCSNLDPEVLLPGILDAATPNLEKLELRLVGRGMTDSVAASLSSQGVLSSLKYLRLTGAYRLSDEGLVSVLNRTPELLSLGLPQCSRIVGPAIEALPQLTPNLKELDVAECRGLGATTLTRAISGLPTLESLTLDGISSEIDDMLLGVIASGAVPMLRCLSLAACPQMTSAGIRKVVAALPHMIKLVLSECSNVDAALVVEIAGKCKQLEEISLRRCINVNDGAVEALSTLDELRKIDLSGIVGLTEVAVVALAKNGAAASLQEVNLSWCRAVSPACLGLLADSCRSLKKLVLWGCSQVDGSDFVLGHSNTELVLVGRD
jgi:DNA repair protein RAD7